MHDYDICQKFAYGEGVEVEETDAESEGNEDGNEQGNGESEDAIAPIDEGEEGGAPKLKPKRPWLWLFGVVIYMGSGALWGVAYIFVPISRLQPILAIAVILNFVFARLVVCFVFYVCVPSVCFRF